jgi:nucleotidyltransferase substrate binding protein (TIGR01987 family)
MTDDTPRWKYRFDNYKRAFTLLRQAMEQETLSALEQEGVIQRFEYTMELAWKTMKDYLESQNLVLDQITPRAVIRTAFEAGIIQDGETWQKALDARNKMSHTYNFETFSKVVEDIRQHYLAVLDAWFFFLLQEAQK